MWYDVIVHGFPLSMNDLNILVQVQNNDILYIRCDEITASEVCHNSDNFQVESLAHRSVTYFCAGGRSQENLSPLML